MFKTCKEKAIVQNALTNTFIDYYLAQHLDSRSTSMFVGRNDVRIVNTHMKLTGKDFVSELITFINIIEESDNYYDLALDHYEEDWALEYCKFVE